MQAPAAHADRPGIEGDTRLDLQQIAAEPAPYGRSCTNCSRAKCRCIIRRDGVCERCVIIWDRLSNGMSRLSRDSGSRHQIPAPPGFAPTRNPRGHFD